MGLTRSSSCPAWDVSGAFGLEAAAATVAVEPGLLKTSIAAGLAKIFAIRSALFAFAGIETDAFWSSSRRSATRWVFLTDILERLDVSSMNEETYNLASMNKPVNAESLD